MSDERGQKRRPLSTLLPAPSVRRLVDHADCSVVFADAANQDTAVEALSGTPEFPIANTKWHGILVIRPRR